ncbi:MAG TPA: 2OG-Fe(II) oxygenase [Arenimonas sp.]|uniref:2OG-Fe(II) oxygenase n=1 Tax=Arenimonas sp. TaxID=1872635 RepID=UPI002D7FE350|nr:2OG-Fe(II) oxygenase [Arenimonas sp.]HEU0152992.1 2OG-Fe(II) oxygenase [Arenimonas sp.]
MAATLPLIPDGLALDALADVLRGRDWATLALDPADARLQAAAAEARAHASAGRLLPAATGRADGRQFAGLRGDATLWLDDPACGPAARDLLAALEALRIEVNRRLLLGLEEVEAHFAHYPPGAGYARHRDRFRSDDARVLSLVVYLNADWPDGAGGELRLHLPDGPVDIAPRLGTVALFLSAEVEHEVLPATHPRYSVAAWFRQRPRR